LIDRFAYSLKITTKIVFTCNGLYWKDAQLTI